MKQIIAGILAHVDAGKTTLSEALLYSSGSIKKIGRVDNGDAFLDTDAMENDTFGYTGTCGFFGRDGADADGA